MRPWWERWPGVFEAEQQAYRDAGLNFTLDEAEFKAGRVVFRGALAVPNHGDVELSVVYPDTYPETRFTVFAPKLALARHQHPFNGNLCLIPRGSANWRPSLRAAPLIAAAVPELLDLLRGDPARLRTAEDPQGEPFTDYYSYWDSGAVLVPGAALALPAGVRRGTLTLAFRDGTRWIEALVDPSRRGAIGQALLASLRDPAGNALATAEPALARGFGNREWTGRWIRLAEPVRADGGDFARKLAEVDATLKHPPLRCRGDVGHFELIGVVFPEEVRQGVFQDAWVFCVIGGKTKSSSLHVALLRGMRCSLEDMTARIPELHPLRTRTASIAGLGALGSPIARELCRGLIGKLRLLDRDHVDAGATVRWFGGLDSAGPLKTAELKQRFERAYPFTEIEPFSLYIGLAPLDRPDEPETRALERWSAGTDLIIDATADDNVSRVINHLASELGIPQIYVWGVDGYGGVVARVIPGRTGCYHCLSLALDPDRGTIRAPTAPLDPARTRVQPRGCGDPTFAAAAPDLEPLATQATRMAFGILCRGAEGGYPAFGDDVLVMTQRQPDGSLTSPPNWAGYALSVHPDCQLCHPELAR